MKRHEGFTLIELLITITIMVILLGLTVVNLRSSQATARDEERKTDVNIIARHLEVFYDSGTDDGATDVLARYPSTSVMDTEAEVKATLRDIDTKALRAPGIAETSSMSLGVAANTSAQNPTINQYIYQPVDRDGVLCTAETVDCLGYTLYYKLEGDAAVQKITSKHQ
ncbi:MAG TPA: type II secretion system protein [Candidatus Saccharimonadales bacterium]